VPQLAKNKWVAPWTGGVQGMEVQKPAAWEWLGLNSDQTLYLIVLIAALICFGLAGNLVRGRIGRALEAIRDQPIAADTMGIDTRSHKIACFGISSFLTGVAGGLGALSTQFVSPESYGFFVSITLLVGAGIGGFRSIYGALVGGAFVVLVPNYAGSPGQGAPSVVYGHARRLCRPVEQAGQSIHAERRRPCARQALSTASRARLPSCRRCCATTTATARSWPAARAWCR